MTQSGLAFVASHLQVEGDLPIEVLPGHLFRAASEAEVVEIRRYLQAAIPPDTFTWAQWAQYEGIIKEERQGSITKFHIEALPREKWKYWVLAFEGSNTTIHELEQVAQILPVSFDVGFVLLYSEQSQGGTIMGREMMPFHVIERYSNPKRVNANAEVVASDQIASLGNSYRALKGLSNEYEFIGRAFRNLSDLRRIPESSDLIIVGLFSILESLITHAPRLSESLDSINHQITNKIILLHKKYTRPIVLSEYFTHANEDKIWKKIYGFRSAVAHGTAVSFDKDYQMLKSRDAVIAFVRDNVKELLRVALADPAFMFDLRKC